MLLNIVNDHIKEYDFDNAIKSLKKEVRKGKPAFLSTTNKTLKKAIKVLQDKNKALKKSRSKFSKNEVEKIGKGIQKLAVKIEEELEPSSIVAGILKFTSKIVGYFLPSLFSIMASAGIYYHFQTPIFDNDDKTKLVIYDFNQLTLKDHNVEDLIKSIINLSNGSSWSHHFHAERLEGVTQLDNYYLNGNENWFTNQIQNNGFLRFLYRYPAANYGITGDFKETSKYFELDVFIHKKDKKEPEELSTIFLDKDLSKLIYEPCRQAKFLYLLNLFNQEKEVYKGEFKNNILNFLKETCDVSLADISTQPPYSNLEFNTETGKPVVEKEVCDEDGSPLPKMVKVFCEMNKNMTVHESRSFNFNSTKDTITITLFFRKDKYDYKHFDGNELGEIGKIVDDYGIDFSAEGHSCIKGDPFYKNEELSEERVKRMLKRMGLYTTKNRKKWSAKGTINPISNDDLKKNRRATIKFFLKTGEMLATKKN